jgi:hypothetical protein
MPRASGVRVGAGSLTRATRATPASRPGLRTPFRVTCVPAGNSPRGACARAGAPCAGSCCGRTSAAHAARRSTTPLKPSHGCRGYVVPRPNPDNPKADPGCSEQQDGPALRAGPLSGWWGRGLPGPRPPRQGRIRAAARSACGGSLTRATPRGPGSWRPLRAGGTTHRQPAGNRPHNTSALNSGCRPTRKEAPS